MYSNLFEIWFCNKLYSSFFFIIQVWEVLMAKNSYILLLLIEQQQKQRFINKLTK